MYLCTSLKKIESNTKKKGLSASNGFCLSKLLSVAFVSFLLAHLTANSGVVDDEYLRGCNS
jgi:hypothetical protein